jgi:hypothetical protein
MRMLNASTSITLPTPTAIATARARIRSSADSRSAAVIILESRTPGIRVPGRNTTHAATTGPAKGPRPASSTPPRRSPQRTR